MEGKNIEQEQTEGTELKVFCVNEWVYVAAHSLEEAKDWHRENFETDEEELREESHEVNDPDKMRIRIEERRDSPTQTAREAINESLAEGKKPPFIVCYDGHYT